MSHVARRTKHVVFINQFLERLMKYDKICNKESFQMKVFGKAVNCTILVWILI